MAAEASRKCRPTRQAKSEDAARLASPISLLLPPSSSIKRSSHEQVGRSEVELFTVEAENRYTRTRTRCWSHASHAKQSQG